VSSHIEWVHARHVQVAGIAEPGEFDNDSDQNEVGCVTITDENGDGICIEGRPEDLIEFAKRVVIAANTVASDTNASAKLRSLYGITDPLDREPSQIHEEMGRQVLDDQYFEPEYNDGGMQ